MPAAIFDWWLAGSPVRQRECGDASCRDECRPRNTAKETKTEAVVAGKPTTHGAMSRKAAAPEITQGMIAQRAEQGDIEVSKAYQVNSSYAQYVADVAEGDAGEW